MKTTADRLREFMNIYGLSQVDIVEKTGVDKTALSRYVSGERKPRQSALTKLCQPFGISEVWLMGYDVPMLDKEDSSDNDPMLVAVIEKIRRLDRDDLLRLDGRLDDMLEANKYKETKEVR
ncbi:MAG: helix-turn-helix domain-containing protein [Oscillospiraceae bacterium]|nr:helix-turn-helix domain-containing protein [Oscillospiraceae bacterium]